MGTVVTKIVRPLFGKLLLSTTIILNYMILNEYLLALILHLRCLHQKGVARLRRRAECRYSVAPHPDHRPRQLPFHLTPHNPLKNHGSLTARISAQS